LERELAKYKMVGQCFGVITEDIKKIEAAQDKMLGFRAIEDKCKQVGNERMGN